MILLCKAGLVGYKFTACRGRGFEWPPLSRAPHRPIPIPPAAATTPALLLCKSARPTRQPNPHGRNGKLSGAAATGQPRRDALAHRIPSSAAAPIGTAALAHGPDRGRRGRAVAGAAAAGAGSIFCCSKQSRGPVYGSQWSADRIRTTGILLFVLLAHYREYLPAGSTPRGRTGVAIRRRCHTSPLQTKLADTLGCINQGTPALHVRHHLRFHADGCCSLVDVIQP